MFTALIVLIVICAVLLMLVVLAQNPKGGGLSSQFGGSGASQMMGVKKTSDFLEKSTWALAIAVLVLTVAANLIQPESNAGGEELSPGLQNAAGASQQPSTPGFNADSIQQVLPTEDLPVADTTQPGN